MNLKKIKLVAFLSIILVPYFVTSSKVIAEELTSSQNGNISQSVESDSKSGPSQSESSSQLSDSTNSGESTQETAESSINDLINKSNSNTAYKSDKNTPISDQPQTMITDPLLEKMIISDNNKNEYSEETINSLLNGTAVNSEFIFNYSATYTSGDIYSIDLPDYIGLTDINDSPVLGVDATYTINTQEKTLTIKFTGTVKDPNFTISLLSDITIPAEVSPVININTPGRNSNNYIFDMYENIAGIGYQDVSVIPGIDGIVTFNLNRKTSGNQNLQIFSRFNGNNFQKLTSTLDGELRVEAYNVDIKGNILTGKVKEALKEGTNYSIERNLTDDDIVINIFNMDKQKAYDVKFKEQAKICSNTNSTIKEASKDTGMLSFGRVVRGGGSGSTWQYYNATIGNEKQVNLKQLQVDD